MQWSVRDLPLLTLVLKCHGGVAILARIAAVSINESDPELPG